MTQSNTTTTTTTAATEIDDLSATVGVMRLAVRYRLPAGYTVNDVLCAVANDETI